MFSRLDRRSLPVAGFLIVGALTAMTALASAAEPQAGALASCAQDLAKWCHGVEAGGGKKMTCLMTNEAQLSPGCDAAVKVRVQHGSQPVQLAQAAPAPSAGAPPPTAAMPPPLLVKPAKSAGRLNKKACKAELATLCATATSSRTKCLMANQPKLGPECSAAVASVMQTREVAKAACVVDAAKLCGGARGAARTQCLEANKAQLSPACLVRIEKKEAKQAVAPKQ